MKKHHLLWLLLLSITSHGQELTPNFIAISVKNIDIEQKWYCDNLGFTVKKAVANVAPGIRFGLLSGNGMLIELIEDTKSVRPAGDPLPHGMFKFGFKVSDMDKLLSTLQSKGIKPKYGPFKSTATDLANFIIEDQEGNLIQFFEIKP